MQNLTNSKATIQHSYRPEQQVCPICHRILKRSHIQWRKEIMFTSGAEKFTSWAYRCEDPGCPGYQQIHVSREAEKIHLWHRRYSREFVVKVGYRRFWLHQTMDELHEWLTQDLKIVISEREILYIIEDFLALLRAGQAAKIAEKLCDRKGLIIGLDGMQPEKGNSCLYLVREMQTGLILLAIHLEDGGNAILNEQIFKPLKAFAQKQGLTWKGVVSDAQHSIRIAVAESLPGTPHQLCQFHCLREAGSLIFESDRGLKTQMKKAFRGQLGRQEQAIRRLSQANSQRSILSDYALAIHSTLLETSTAPFDLASLRIFEALSDIAASLERCQKKGLPHFYTG